MNISEIKKLFKKQLIYLCNTEYSLYIILAYRSIKKQYLVNDKFKFFDYSVLAFNDSLWKNLFCIIDKDKGKYKEPNYSIFELINDLKTINTTNSKLTLYESGEYRKEISFRLFLYRFSKFINSKPTDKTIERIKNLRNTFFHPIKKFILNSQIKTRTIIIGNKQKKVNLNVKDCTIYDFIIRIKDYYFSLAKYLKINLNFYYEKLNSENELDEILSILEENYLQNNDLKINAKNI